MTRYRFTTDDGRTKLEHDRPSDRDALATGHQHAVRHRTGITVTRGDWLVGRCRP